MHPNAPIAPIPRFMDMGAEPFLLASTLNIIAAQRLVRKICPNCKVTEDLPADVRLNIEKDLKNLPDDAWYEGVKANKDFIVYRGKGCTQCGGSGYKGRLAITEVFNVTKKMREIIAQGFHQADVMAELKQQKFVNINQDGWMKALLGLTTVEEILRVTRAEE